MGASSPLKAMFGVGRVKKRRHSSGSRLNSKQPAAWSAMMQVLRPDRHHTHTCTHAHTCARLFPYVRFPLQTKHFSVHGSFFFQSCKNMREREKSFNRVARGGLVKRGLKEASRFTGGQGKHDGGARVCVCVGGTVLHLPHERSHEQVYKTSIPRDCPMLKIDHSHRPSLTSLPTLVAI